MANPTVSVVKGSVEDQALHQKYGDQLTYNYGQNQFVGNDRQDTIKQYDKYLSNSGVNPINNNVDLNSIKGVNVANGQLANAQGQPIYDAQSTMGNMQNQLGQQATAYVQQQKAQLDQALQSQISQLSNAYNQAITDGQISVRDAQTQFAQQKQQIEQMAYEQSQQTMLTGQDLGIQNSQQLMGLMQGDNARTTALTNQNMSARDKTIRDITDRLNNIKLQRDTSLAQAKSTYDSGLLKAGADATMNLNQGLFNMNSDALNANRQQQFAQDNMATQNQYQLGQMLQKHNFDVQDMATQLENTMKINAQQFGFSSALQSQQAKSAMDQITAQAKIKAQQAQDDYSKALEIASKTWTDPSSQEYQINQAQLKQARDQKIQDAYTGAVAEYNAQQILQNPALQGDTTKPPSYWMSPLSTISPITGKEVTDPISSIIEWGMNLANGYNADNTSYQKTMDAIARKNAFLKSIGVGQ